MRSPHRLKIVNSASSQSGDSPSTLKQSFLPSWFGVNTFAILTSRVLSVLTEMGSFSVSLQLPVALSMMNLGT